MRDQAIVRSREPLTKAQLDDLKRKLAAGTVKNEIDPTITAGFLVQVGDRVYDYSLEGALHGRDPGESVSVGRVTYVGDGVIKVSGLAEVMAGEKVKFPDGWGIALNLEEDEVGVVALAGFRGIKPGDRVESTGQILSVAVGRELVGRVINPLGEPLDGKGEYRVTQYNPLEKIAPGVIARESVSAPVQTGVKSIDAMIPIGRGQRELIIGDRQTGKSSLALTTMINQKDEKITCIYVAIGQKRSSIAQLIATLERFEAMGHVIIVAATASDPAAFQYLAPYVGCAIAEYFLSQGEDALVIYDDLSKHAWAYRQISLLLRRPSGREAYPGDIFYAHSRLLERSCRLNRKHGGGSITALPIVETQAGDISAYIPTNVISITDGQIYLVSDLFNAGQRPAVDVGISVSRVGGAAQIKAYKQVAGRMRLELAQYKELEAFAQFASDLDEKTQAQLNRGRKLSELLKQGWDEPMPLEEQILVIWAATHGALDPIPVENVKHFEKELLESARYHHQDVLQTIVRRKELDEKLERKMEQIVDGVKEKFGEKDEQKTIA